MTDTPNSGTVSAAVERLSPEALSTLLGMIEYCLNARVCMGMDEGFKSFDSGEEHDFVKELRAILAQPADQQDEPAGWQFYQDGKWWNGDDRIKDHRANTEAAGYQTRDVYARPAAQVVKLPERMKMEPYQTVNQSSTNYKAGFNACRAKTAKLNGIEP